MKETIREILQPVADIFSGLGTPEPIVHWGHPLMMAIVIFVIGSFVGITGWRIRKSVETDVVATSKGEHRKIAPLLYLFITLGYSGGILSLIMQGEPIFSSVHFWTGSTVIALLSLNGLISLTGFGGNQATLRASHAYIGSLALVIMFVHALFGLKLGLSI